MKQEIHQQSRHRSLFLYKFLQSPKNIGSIVPSSSFLAQKIMEPINWDEVDTIVELGAYRETIIQTVCRSLKPGGIFMAFQYSLQMKAMLKQCFGEVGIHFVPSNIPPAFVYRCNK